MLSVDFGKRRVLGNKTLKEKKSKFIAKWRYPLIQPYSTNARQVLYNQHIEKLVWIHQQNLIMKINWNIMSLASLSLSKHKATASKTTPWKHHLRKTGYVLSINHDRHLRQIIYSQLITDENPVAGACVVIWINGNRRWKKGGNINLQNWGTSNKSSTLASN